MLRPALLAAARSARLRSLVQALPVTRSVVDRFVAGDCVADAVAVTRRLAEDGRRVTLDHLGEGVADGNQAGRTADAYRLLLGELDAAGLAGGVDVSVKLSAVGQFLPVDGEKIALANAQDICESAAAVGATVTLDMEDHTTTDSTLSVLRELRVDFPWVGAVLQAYLRRTEGDCRDLSGEGSRVRLCKGAYSEPASVAFGKKAEVDLSYVRCLRVLMAGRGYPMVGSHDPRMIAIASRLATIAGRAPSDHEFQMLYGIRPEEQHRIAADGDIMRIYVPYGEAWYGYFMRRLAERPANVGFFLRSFTTKS
jgi:proline dehydrogenase